MREAARALLPFVLGCGGGSGRDASTNSLFLALVGKPKQREQESASAPERVVQRPRAASRRLVWSQPHNDVFVHFLYTILYTLRYRNILSNKPSLIFALKEERKIIEIYKNTAWSFNRRCTFCSAFQNELANCHVNEFFSQRFLLYIAECTFGKQVRELGSTWYADLGPPFGIMYCIKCECIPVSI